MATYDVQIKNGGAVARRREPWVVGVLSLVTLYGYAIYLWYQMARELRDLGQAQGTDLGREPGQSAVAISLGIFVVVPFVATAINTCKRVQRAQRLAGSAERLNGWIAGLSLAFLSPVFFAYVQSQLNQVWEADAIAEPTDPAALPDAARASRYTAPTAGNLTAATPPMRAAAGTAGSANAGTAPADWYPDPKAEARLRYWDGATWTAHTAD